MIYFIVLAVIIFGLFLRIKWEQKQIPEIIYKNDYSEEKKND